MTLTSLLLNTQVLDVYNISTKCENGMTMNQLVLNETLASHTALAMHNLCNKSELSLLFCSRVINHNRTDEW